jgi:hypothetical protein
MTRLSEEEIRHLQYQIYRLSYDDPWITTKQISKSVNRSISTVKRYSKEAEKEIIVPAQHLRLNSPFKRVTLLLFEDKWKAYNELQEYPGVTYLSVYQGDWDITAVYDGFMDFSQISGYKGKMMEGSMGRIFTHKVTYTSWDACFSHMQKLLEQKNPEQSTVTCELRYPEWNDDHWKMFNYFKLDLKKKFSYLRKECPISWRCYEEWKDALRDYCTVITYYFPEGYLAYDSFTLCFKTGYEQYIVDLFSTFPTSSIFHKVGDYLLVNIFVPLDYEKQMRIYDIVSQLLNKKSITEYLDGNRIMYWYCKEEKPVADNSSLVFGEHISSRLVAEKVYSRPVANYIDVRSLTEKLKFKKLTGLLKVTHDACNGIIIFDGGAIIDGYEIFNNELLVRDQDGSNMFERCKTKPGKIDVYDVRRDILQVFLRGLQDGSTEEFPASFRLFL